MFIKRAALSLLTLSAILALAFTALTFDQPRASVAPAPPDTAHDVPAPTPDFTPSEPAPITAQAKTPELTAPSPSLSAASQITPASVPASTPAFTTTAPNPPEATASPPYVPPAQATTPPSLARPANRHAVDSSPRSPSSASSTPATLATASPRPATPTPTPAVSSSDSNSGTAIHCEVNSSLPMTDTERIALLAACPTGSPAVCGSSLAARINEAPAGSVLNLTGCTYTSAPFNITRPITVIGPTVSFPTTNAWGDGVWLSVNNVTLDRWTFLSAGLPVGFASVQNISVVHSRFEGYLGGPIGMWGPVRNVLIEGNTFKNTRNTQSGFVGGRGNEGSNPCPEVGRYVTIRGNTGDQNTNGWFGIELKCFADVIIERNTLSGGAVLISLPDSNRVTIRDNNLDLRGSAYWGVEVAKAHDVRLENNTIHGDGPSSGDDAFSANSCSLRAIVLRNIATNLRTLYVGPIQADIRLNCLENVAFVTQFGSPETSTISNNGAC